MRVTGPCCHKNRVAGKVLAVRALAREAARLYEGTSEIQRLIIGGGLVRAEKKKL